MYIRLHLDDILTPNLLVLQSKLRGYESTVYIQESLLTYWICYLFVLIPYMNALGWGKF